MHDIEKKRIVHKEAHEKHIEMISYPFTSSVEGK